MRYGYFDNQAKEYVIDRIDVPVSWTKISVLRLAGVSQGDPFPGKCCPHGQAGVLSVSA